MFYFSLFVFSVIIGFGMLDNPVCIVVHVGLLLFALFVMQIKNYLYKYECFAGYISNYLLLSVLKTNFHKLIVNHFIF